MMGNTPCTFRPMTIADLCEAIAAGDIAYKREHDNYTVNGGEMHRLGREHRTPVLDMAPGPEELSFDMSCSA